MVLNPFGDAHAIDEEVSRGRKWREDHGWGGTNEGRNQGDKIAVWGVEVHGQGCVFSSYDACMTETCRLAMQVGLGDAKRGLVWEGKGRRLACVYA